MRKAASNPSAPTPTRKLQSNRKRSQASRRRRRTEPPRGVVLPDIGLTSQQLGALAGFPEGRIFQCAKELEESVYDAQSVLPSAVVELVTEELGLNMRYSQQSEPLISESGKNAIMHEASEVRMPIITVMGHVDHGKTSLLDALRNSDVAENEAGGITQSVAAFQVPINAESDSAGSGDTKFATFIDTPGHAAFKKMRTNGTVATDIVLLVVAADDGVMPQTVEAANLAKSANVPVVVAINKCDRAGADPDRVRYELLERLGLNTEQLGGDVQSVEISAKEGTNLPQLLEAIALQADMLDLRTLSDTLASGVCLESRVDKSLGSIATIVVRMGTLKKGDHLAFQSPRALSGKLYGRVRSLIGSDGGQVSAAGPGVAVGVCGIRETIPPGAEVCAMKTERLARSKSDQIIAQNEAAIATIELANSLYAEITTKREEEEKKKLLEKGIDPATAIDAELEQEKPDGKPASLVVLIKADVKGSADAVAQCVQAISSAEVPIRIVTAGVGEINETDLQIAGATRKVKGNHDNFMIVGFNVKAKDTVLKTARQAGVAILQHSLIYHLEDEIKDMVATMVADQQVTEEQLGGALVVKIFEDGAIAGCKVDEGQLSVGDTARIMRLPDKDSLQSVRHEVFMGKVSSIKHFAKSVRFIKQGNECGVSLEDWKDFRAGDQIECILISDPGQKRQ